MKKYKHFLRFSFLIFLLEILAVIALATREVWVQSVYPFMKVSCILLGIWFCGTVFLCITKGKLHSILSRFLTACTATVTCVILVFSAACLLVAGHPNQGDFSLSTTLFDDKNVMVVVPHQDDDINLLGGLIEQYVDCGSEISIVFTTNGDRYGQSELRAAETVSVLTELGVEQENIYYLGFGDRWTPQTVGDEEIQHIYNSTDPDLVWTSLYGATETYGTESIDCYLDLPYTRNNYVHSLQSVILEKMPDTIFAVDFDSHIDHRATDLFFEEALCNILTLYPQYDPTVYKGFCYGTAWTAVDDYFDSINLLSSKKPDDATWAAAAFGYAWEERVRFPMSDTNLNWILSNNSVYRSLDQYASQDAWLQAERILNGDKVFWERRTDSLLYDAEIFVDGEKTKLLNDFKLKDFSAISEDSGINAGIVHLQNRKITVKIENPVTINSIYLYDSADISANILEGYITFSDGSKIEFGELEKDGSATKLSFPERQVSWMEVVVTKQSSELSGLSEIEAFYDSPESQKSDDTYLMAADSDDNFVYDYMLHGSDTVSLKICSFPSGTPLGESDVTLRFEASGDDASYRWENDSLIIDCATGSECTVTVSDEASSTTFSVSNLSEMEYAYLQALRAAERLTMNIKFLYNVTKDYVLAFVEAHF